MKDQVIETFDHSEFEEASESGMDALSIGKWDVQDIHMLIIETMDVYEALGVEGGIIPSEWKTGFVFGIIQEFVVRRLVEKYGEQIRSYLNRH
jgi:hypothetical protein